MADDEKPVEKSKPEPKDEGLVLRVCGVCLRSTFSLVCPNCGFDPAA